MGLTYSSVIDASLEEVFAWHQRPGAITRMLPPWQPIRLIQEASSVRDGEAVLALPGGLRWVAGHEPDSYDPPRQFADALRPPLSVVLRWEHRHLFAPSGEHGTLVTDVVGTPVPARVLRPMFGELAAASQRARPAALAAAGHQFRYPGLEGALRHVLGRDPVPAATAKLAMAPIAMRG
jgi:ligand-binding SRPBCC domain-containing protein